MTLGSLFDGSGGFPLAGIIHGITPVWASEIEPYPIRVTKARFPQMKHLGSVLDVDGAEVEPVDIITFGSPCQDLSVAGKQAGLHKGERSNLFFEAIRIIKEMREATDGRYPRIAVWENVPGAYSSNKGEDFRAVLEAFVQIKDETADVPRPAAGKWHPAGAIVGSGWSVAWRTFDAKFWGVPQRRKRIYLIADFGSERAPEILFKRESVFRDIAPSGAAGQGTPDNVEGSVGGGCGVRCLNPWDSQSKRIFEIDGVYPTLPAMDGGGANNQAVIYPVGAFCAGAAPAAGSIGYSEHVAPTLKSAQCGFPMGAVVYEARGNGTGDMAYSVDCRNMNLTPEHGTLQAKENGGQSLNYMGAVVYPQAVLYEPMSALEENWAESTVKNALRAGASKSSHAVCYPINTMVATRWKIIRRLTPLECCRLQGFPDWWSTPTPYDPADAEFWEGVRKTHAEINGKTYRPVKDIKKWYEKLHTDSAEYKMWGNGIALPNAEHVIGCAKRLIQGGKHED